MLQAENEIVIVYISTTFIPLLHNTTTLVRHNLLFMKPCYRSWLKIEKKKLNFES